MFPRPSRVNWPRPDPEAPIDANTRTTLDNLLSPDGPTRYEALLAIVKATDQPVDWAYDVWDDFLADLKHADPHRRARAAQILCGLAKSDPKQRMLKDFDAILAVTHDEKFVTARHTLQSLWKVGLAGKKQQALVLDRLAARFSGCAAEKNCTLIRYDIIEDLRKLYDAAPDEAIQARALALIETETDDKYRKKYAAVWRRA